MLDHISELWTETWLLIYLNQRILRQIISQIVG